MNIERLTQLRDHIRSLPNLPTSEVGFNMGTFRSTGDETLSDRSGHNCNTTCCIGGWAIELFSTARHKSYCSHEAAELLDITSRQAKDLFYPDTDHPTAWNAAPLEAAEAIDRLINGQYPWPMPEVN